MADAKLSLSLGLDLTGFLSGLDKAVAAFRQQVADLAKPAPLKLDTAPAETGMKRLRDEHGRFISAARQKVSPVVDTSSAQAEIQKLRNELEKMQEAAKGGAGGGMLAGLGGVGVVAAGAAAGIGLIAHKMIDANSEMEKFETQIGTLLKGTEDFKSKYKNVTDPLERQKLAAEGAKDRIAELARFGAETPFDLPEIAAAEKVLLGFGLTGKKALELTGQSATDLRTTIGDVAAGVGVPFQELTVTLGKFSTGATGEAISRLQELGVVTKEELKKAGVEFDKAGSMTSPVQKGLTAAVAIMKDKFGGGMKDLSSTFGGQMSTLGDSITQTLGTMGAPLFDAAKEALGGVLAMFNAAPFQAIVQGIAAALQATIVPAMTAIGAVLGFIGENSGVFLALAIGVGAYMLVANAGAIATGLFAAAQGVATFAAGALTTAMGFLNAAFLASPIGLITGLIAGGVAAFSLLSGKTKELGEATKDAAEAQKAHLDAVKEAKAVQTAANNIRTLADRYDELAKKSDPKSQKEMAKIAEELQAKVPGASATISAQGRAAESAGKQILLSSEYVRMYADEQERLANAKVEQSLVNADAQAAALGASLNATLEEQAELTEEFKKYDEIVRAAGDVRAPMDFESAKTNLGDAAEELTEINKKIAENEPLIKEQIQNWQKSGMSVEEMAAKLHLTTDQVKLYGGGLTDAVITADQLNDALEGVAPETAKQVRAAAALADQFANAEKKVADLKAQIESKRMSGDAEAVKQLEGELQKAQETASKTKLELNTTVNTKEFKTAFVSLPQEARASLGKLNGVVRDALTDAEQTAAQNKIGEALAKGADISNKLTAKDSLAALVTDYQNAGTELEKANIAQKIQAAFGDEVIATFDANGAAMEVNTQKALEMAGAQTATFNSDLTARQKEYKDGIAELATSVANGRDRMAELKAEMDKQKAAGKDVSALRAEYDRVKGSVDNNTKALGNAVQQGKKYGLIKGDIKQVSTEFGHNEKQARAVATAVTQIGDRAKDAVGDVASLSSEFDSLYDSAGKASKQFVSALAGLQVKENALSKQMTSAMRAALKDEANPLHAQAKFLQEQLDGINAQRTSLGASLRSALAEEKNLAAIKKAIESQFGIGVEKKAAKKSTTSRSREVSTADLEAQLELYRAEWTRRIDDANSELQKKYLTAQSQLKIKQKELDIERQKLTRQLAVADKDSRAGIVKSLGELSVKARTDLKIAKDAYIRELNAIGSELASATLQGYASELQAEVTALQSRIDAITEGDIASIEEKVSLMLEQAEAKRQSDAAGLLGKSKAFEAALKQATQTETAALKNAAINYAQAQFDYEEKLEEAAGKRATALDAKIEARKKELRKNNKKITDAEIEATISGEIEAMTAAVESEYQAAIVNIETRYGDIARAALKGKNDAEGKLVQAQLGLREQFVEMMRLPADLSRTDEATLDRLTEEQRERVKKWGDAEWQMYTSLATADRSGFLREYDTMQRQLDTARRKTDKDIERLRRETKKAADLAAADGEAARARIEALYKVEDDYDKAIDSVELGEANMRYAIMLARKQAIADSKTLTDEEKKTAAADLIAKFADETALFAELQTKFTEFKEKLAALEGDGSLSDSDRAAKRAALEADYAIELQYAGAYDVLQRRKLEAEESRAAALRDLRMRGLREENALLDTALRLGEALRDAYHKKEERATEDETKKKLDEYQKQTAALRDQLQKRLITYVEFQQQMAAAAQQLGEREVKATGFWERMKQGFMEGTATFATTTQKSYEEKSRRMAEKAAQDWEAHMERRRKLEEQIAAREMELASARATATEAGTKEAMDAYDALVASATPVLDDLKKKQQELTFSWDAIIGAAENAAIGIGAALGQMIANGEASWGGFFKAIANGLLDLLEGLVPTWSAMILGISLASAGPLGIASWLALTAVLEGVVAGARAAVGGMNFATGVVGLMGPGSETSDSIAARLSRGESVLTARGTNAPGNADLFRWINRTGGSWTDYFSVVASTNTIPAAVRGGDDAVQAAHVKALHQNTEVLAAKMEGVESGIAALRTDVRSLKTPNKTTITGTEINVVSDRASRRSLSLG